uniref:Uncharacterized protein n=1 Tax=Oryza barthii TaxID=65489 RepID=A0A0D3F447_9ORYZ
MDINSLQFLYSSQSESVMGGHTSKAPSGKEDFLITVDEKHDYDRSYTCVVGTIFEKHSSFQAEDASSYTTRRKPTNSSQMIFQKKQPIPQPVKPSASRVGEGADQISLRLKGGSYRFYTTLNCRARD